MSNPYSRRGFRLPPRGPLDYLRSRDGFARLAADAIVKWPPPASRTPNLIYAGDQIHCFGIFRDCTRLMFASWRTDDRLIFVDGPIKKTRDVGHQRHVELMEPSASSSAMNIIGYGRSAFLLLADSFLRRMQDHHVITFSHHSFLPGFRARRRGQDDCRPLAVDAIRNSMLGQPPLTGYFRRQRAHSSAAAFRLTPMTSANSNRTQHFKPTPKRASLGLPQS